MGNKKISIIIPVYNEEGLMGRCLEALINQDYPKEDYEIVVVNDGSTDGTFKVIREEQTEARRKKVNLGIIDLEKNMGQIIARENGVKNAKFGHLLFIDSRCIVGRNVLKNIVKVNYQPMVADVYIDDRRSYLDRFNYLLRKRIYFPYYGQNIKQVFITKNNFDKIPKGHGGFFCDKKLFLRCRVKNKGKSSANDTRLLWNIVQRKKILRCSYAKIAYVTRASFKETLRHTFERGPIFVDFHLARRKQRFWLFIFLPTLLLIFTIAIFFLNHVYFLYWLATVILGCIIVSLWMAENIRDFFIMMCLLPFICSSFELGILKGLFLKLTKK